MKFQNHNFKNTLTMAYLQNLVFLQFCASKASESKVQKTGNVHHVYVILNLTLKIKSTQKQLRYNILNILWSEGSEDISPSPTLTLIFLTFKPLNESSWNLACRCAYVYVKNQYKQVKALPSKLAEMSSFQKTL